MEFFRGEQRKAWVQAEAGLFSEDGPSARARSVISVGPIFQNAFK